MNCLEARNKLFESFDNRVSFGEEPEVTSHLSACSNCSQFAELQRAIDEQLLESFRVPVLSADFQPKLRRRIQGYQREQWATWLPDAAYVAGAVVALVLCTALLPIPHSIVISSGAIIGIAVYVMQSVALSTFEELSMKDLQ